MPYLRSTRCSQLSQLSYRWEVDWLVLWCNNLELNKRWRRSRQWRQSQTRRPLTILSSPVSCVEIFNFFGSIISKDLMWDNDTEYLRRFSRGWTLCQRSCWFYFAVIRSVLCFGVEQTAANSENCWKDHCSISSLCPGPLLHRPLPTLPTTSSGTETVSVLLTTGL